VLRTSVCALAALDQQLLRRWPPTWTSNTYIPAGDNFNDLSPTTPQILSTASVVPTSAVQESDLSAYAQSSFAACLNSYFLSFVRATVSQQGGNVDSMRTVPVAVASVPGVETVEYDLQAEIVASGDVVPYRNRMIFIGAGRMEEMLQGFDSTAEPIPSTTWNALVGTLQHRMATVASFKTPPPKTTKK
jgi:hypothetical protein